MTLDAKPVIIIGAPRSGTNMLRDALTALPGNATWPCDEINPIWRHGNVRHPTDEFDPDMARPPVRDYIRRRFGRCAQRPGGERVIEKTCANSLRVAFIDRILPDALYVVIRRDGVDAAVSAAARWNAPLDLAYLARKARFVPMADLPYHVASAAAARLRRLAPGRRPERWWGPRIEDAKELARRHPVLELAALQWRRCVDLADRQLASVPAERRIEIAYEDFVRDPQASLERVGRFLGGEWTGPQIEAAAADVSPASIGKGHQALSEPQHGRLLALLGESMRRHGYA